MSSPLGTQQPQAASSGQYDLTPSSRTVSGPSHNTQQAPNPTTPDAEAKVAKPKKKLVWGIVAFVSTLILLVVGYFTSWFGLIHPTPANQQAITSPAPRNSASANGNVIPAQQNAPKTLVGTWKGTARLNGGAGKAVLTTLSIKRDGSYTLREHGNTHIEKGYAVASEGVLTRVTTSSKGQHALTNKASLPAPHRTLHLESFRLKKQ